jgi:ATP-dependent Lhr-like helicase
MDDQARAALKEFSPLIARWFADKHGSPTAVQARAWAALREGSHVLVSAPTGTGKTLAAFLLRIGRAICLPAAGPEQRHPA